MRLDRCLPALALLAFLPARADEGAAKAPPRADGKTSVHSCCAGEEGADKTLCPKGKAKTAKKKTAAKAKPEAATGKAPDKKAAATAAPASGSANMVVTRDPVTGEIRNATAAERAALFAGRAPQAAPAAPQIVVLPDGTEMMRLGEDAMSYAIATVSSDGTVTQTCVHGKDAATAAFTAPQPAPKPAATPRAEER